jgi:hypothetical protein
LTAFGTDTSLIGTCKRAQSNSGFRLKTSAGSGKGSKHLCVFSPSRAAIMDGDRGAFHPEQNPSRLEAIMRDPTGGANNSTASLLDLLQGLALAERSDSTADREDESPSVELPFDPTATRSSSESLSQDSSIFEDVDVAASTATADGPDGLEFIQEYKEQLSRELAGVGVGMISEADKPVRMAELVQEFGPFPESAGPEIFLAETPGMVELLCFSFLSLTCLLRT